MRPKQTATEAARTGARRRRASPLYIALLLLAAFSVSWAACPGESYGSEVDVIQVDIMQRAKDVMRSVKKKYDDLLSSVQSELASPTPDLMQIGVWLNEMEEDRRDILIISTNVPGSEMVLGVDEGALKDQIADLTDQFNRLGGWGVANAQHQVLTSGGTWNWVTVGTNPDLNPGGPTFTGTTSPGGGGGGGGGCAPGETFIIGVGCVH